MAPCTATARRTHVCIADLLVGVAGTLLVSSGCHRVQAVPVVASTSTAVSRCAHSCESVGRKAVRAPTQYIHPRRGLLVNEAKLTNCVVLEAEHDNTTHVVLNGTPCLCCEHDIVLDQWSIDNPKFEACASFGFFNVTYSRAAHGEPLNTSSRAATNSTGGKAASTQLSEWQRVKVRFQRTERKLIDEQATISGAGLHCYWDQLSIPWKLSTPQPVPAAGTHSGFKKFLSGHATG